jgi:formylglycine-generating enzyme required for sulfatase activity
VHDVFISHSSEDRLTANAICHALESEGIRCWIAPRDIMPGEEWAEAISRAIKNSSAMLLVFSGHANASQQVKREVGRAVSNAITIVPLRIEDIMPSGALEYFIGSVHWLDILDRPLEKHLKMLSGKVKALLKVLQSCNTSEARRPGTDLHKSNPPGTDVRLSTQKSRQSIRHFANSTGMEFAWLPPGEFLMASPLDEIGRSDEETQHEVRLSKKFALGICPVTRRQFAAFVEETGYRTEAEKSGGLYVQKGNRWLKIPGKTWRNPGFEQSDDHPVVGVSWSDAKTFCDWLRIQERRPYRLPTEAEWEYACRAGTMTAYQWGDDPDDGEGWCNASDLTAKKIYPNWATFNWDDGYIYTSPVGSFFPNAWGLYDMHGNVNEWCSDWHGPYPKRRVTDPAGKAEGQHRVVRGGSWQDLPARCRSACRARSAPHRRNSSLGFRVAL